MIDVERDRPRLFRVLRHWGVEVAAVVVVVFGAFVALGHLAQSNWVSILLYNADSIVLPLIEKSIQEGQPFQWVFSSQLFIFPEGLLYALSSAFTDEPRVALATNLVLNLVSLYVLLRVIAHFLSRHSRHRFLEIAAALVATGLFGVYVLLEPEPQVNGTTIATLFLLTTYYYGVILVGLATIALMLWVGHTFGGTRMGPRRRLIGYGVGSVALIGISTLSDPLVLMQVVAPIVVAMLVLLFAARVDWRTFLWMTAPLLVGGVVGYLARRLFRKYIQAEVGSYLSLNQIPDSARLLARSLRELLETPGGTLKLLLAGGLVLVSMAVFVFALYAQARPRLAARITTAEFFLSAFVSVSAVSLVAGQVLTGAPTTRYLEPVFIFPLVMLLAIGISVIRRLLVTVERIELRRNLASFASGVMALAAALIVVFGVMAIPPTASMLRGDGYTLNDCLDEVLGDTDADGVASFWLARPLELYGDQDGLIAQVDAALAPFPWMNNLADYDRPFSFVLLDQSDIVSEVSVEGLGEPRAVYHCPAYDVLDYSGTDGQDELNETIQDGLDSTLEEKGY